MRWYTYSSIFDLDPNFDLIFPELLITPSDSHSTLASEFDCVRNQVQQYLFDPKWISDQPRRVRAERTGKVQVDLLAPTDRSQCFDGILHDMTK